MKFCSVLVPLCSVCRAPQGARGLKCDGYVPQEEVFRRAPQGARGLKYGLGDSIPPCPPRRAPQGARGLKCKAGRARWYTIPVAPRKGRVG